MLPKYVWRTSCEFFPCNCRALHWSYSRRVHFYLWVLLIVQALLLTFTYPLDKKSYKLSYAFQVASLLVFIVVAPSHSLLTKTWCVVVSWVIALILLLIKVSEWPMGCIRAGVMQVCNQLLTLTSNREAMLFWAGNEQMYSFRQQSVGELESVIFTKLYLN